MAYGASMIKIYGIKNCDTVRKALKWADEQGLEFQFYDFKKVEISSENVEQWMEAAGKDILINKRGTTYRKLSDGEKEFLESDKAVELLVQQPTLMKRPVFDIGGKIIVGFKESEKEDVLNAS